MRLGPLVSQTNLIFSDGASKDRIWRTSQPRANKLNCRPAWHNYIHRLIVGYQPQGGEEARDRPFSIEGDYVPHVKEGSSSWKWQWQSCCSSWKSSSWKPSYNPDWSGIWTNASPMISPMMLCSAGLFFPLKPPPLPSELPLYLAPLNHDCLAVLFHGFFPRNLNVFSHNYSIFMVESNNNCKNTVEINTS